jgi:hypothetical protein
MAHRLALAEIRKPGVDLPKLPLFHLHVPGDSLSGKKRLGALGTLCKGVKTLLRIRIEPNGKGFCHSLCSVVYEFLQYLESEELPMQGGGARRKNFAFSSSSCGLRNRSDMSDLAIFVRSGTFDVAVDHSAAKRYADSKDKASSASPFSSLMSNCEP